MQQSKPIRTSSSILMLGTRVFFSSPSGNNLNNFLIPFNSYVELYNSSFRNLLKSGPNLQARRISINSVNSPMDVSHENLPELESVDISSPPANSKGSHISPLTSTVSDKIEIHECAFIGTFLAGSCKY
jgi:hypothetical protein